MFTIREKSAFFVRKCQIFDLLQPKASSSSAANFLQINSAWYNLKNRGRLFFLKKVYSSLDIGKVTTYIHLLRSVFSCIQTFSGFTSSVGNQHLSRKHVLFSYK